MTKQKELWQLAPTEKIDDMVSGLRKLADFLEKNKEVLAGLNFSEYVSVSQWNYKKEDFKKTAKIIGRAKKDWSDSHVSMEKQFSRSVVFRNYISRKQVCERVVVGTKEIAEQVIPARTEEIVEWKCSNKALLK